MPLSSAVIGIALAVVITALIVWNVAISYRKKVVESKIGSAEEKAREIIDEAVKTAETKKREGLLMARDQAIQAQRGNCGHLCSSNLTLVEEM